MTPDATEVTIAGGGIAGMTAALRLAERGCDVTIYEEKGVLGGNLASDLPARRIKALEKAAAQALASGDASAGSDPRVDALRRELGLALVSDTTPLHLDAIQRAGALVLDVYPHMYQAWYLNFWELLEDAGVDIRREDDELHTVPGFSSFTSFHQMRKKEGFRRPEETGLRDFATLTFPYSAGHMLENLASGVAPPADMFTIGYASVDLQAELMNPTVRLHNMSLTGYLNSRRYLSQAAIDAYETLITTVWGLPAYLISAAEYRAYAAYCYGAAEEDSWLTTGPAADTIVRPIERAFKGARVKAQNGKVTIRTHTRVAGVKCEPVRSGVQRKRGVVSTILLEETEYDCASGEWVVSKELKPKSVQNLLLAIPPKPLAGLVRAGNQGERITDFLPQLRELTRVQSERMPMLHLVFTGKRTYKGKAMPPEPVSLAGSELKLAFTDISRTWNGQTFRERTILAVSCSEPSKLPGGWEENARAIIDELKHYLDFDNADIDETMTRYRENDDVQLSLNTIGTDRWRPHAHFSEMQNLFFAGDFCRNPFGITTVEAAVATGVEAANAVVKARKLRRPIRKPAKLPDSDFVAMRYAWIPFAYAAWAASKASEYADASTGRRESEMGGLRYLLTPGLRPEPKRGG